MGLVHRVLPTPSWKSCVNGILKTLCENAPLSIANPRPSSRNT
jgi:hypothetical protein